jgi:hypothetical protein
MHVQGYVKDLDLRRAVQPVVVKIINIKSSLSDTFV